MTRKVISVYYQTQGEKYQERHFCNAKLSNKCKY